MNEPNKPKQSPIVRAVDKFIDTLADDLGKWTGGLITVGFTALAALFWPYVLASAVFIHDHVPGDAWALMCAAVLVAVEFLLRRYLSLRAALKLRESEFQSYGGVLWKVFPFARYVEQSPYCTCCDPPRVLARNGDILGDQNLLTCPVSGRNLHIVNNGAPRRVEASWELVTTSWFHNFGKILLEETARQRELHPHESDKEIFRRVMRCAPQKKIPRREIWRLKRRFATPMEILNYLERHQGRYWKYMVKRR